LSSPREQWPQLWHFFDVLHQDYDLEEDKDACLRAWTAQADDLDLHRAIEQWHEAFDAAPDAEVARIVESLNPWWDPNCLFGGAQKWAEWVRAHLERELASRKA
jgi:hypothetical protein